MDTVKSDVISANSSEHTNTSERQSRFLLPSFGNNPAKILTMEEIVNVLDNIQKMEIIHEIALNPNFKLQPYEPPENSIEKAVKENMNKAFWDILREQLNSDPPCYDQALQLVSEIKENLPDIISPNNQRAIELIDKILDISVIKEQIEMGIINFRSYADFIIHIMAKSCAPVRDEQIRKLSQEEDVVTIFKGIFETMTLMKLDMANWLLEFAKQDLLTHSVSYEKERFQEYLKYYNSSFPATENWLKRNQTEDENGIKSAPDETIYNAYMELLDWDYAHEFPEILSIDKERLFEISNEALKLCICASIMAICSGMSIISQKTKNRTSLAYQIYILCTNLIRELELKDILEQIWLHVKTTITKHIPEEHLNPLQDALEETVKAQILQLEDKKSPVFKLMWDRLKLYISLIFRTKSALCPIPPGYNDYKDQLESVANLFHRVINYNYSVYRDYYVRLLSDERKVLNHK